MSNTFEIILEVLKEIPDPRVERSKIHNLEIIMFIALCSSLCGGQSFYDMELFAETREEWLKEKIGMVSIPSHDTFNRVFQAISPQHFGECLINLTTRLREKISGDVVAFDEKTHRGGYFHQTVAYAYRPRPRFINIMRPAALPVRKV